MAALWDLDWTGPVPTANQDDFAAPVKRSAVPEKVRVTAKTWAREFAEQSSNRVQWQTKIISSVP